MQKFGIFFTNTLIIFIVENSEGGHILRDDDMTEIDDSKADFQQTKNAPSPKGSLSDTFESHKLLPSSTDMLPINAQSECHQTNTDNINESNHPIDDDQKFVVTVVKTTTHKHKSTWSPPKQNTSPTNLSSSSASTGSSPNSALQTPNTSTEFEQNLEKGMERKLLRKMEYYLMEIFQHLNENETEDSESGSNKHAQKINSDTSHKNGPASSKDIGSNEPGPSQ